MLATTQLTVARLLLFLCKDKPLSVAYVMNFWQDNGVLSVAPWKYGGGSWALHIDLKPLCREGEEAYIPFSRAKLGGKPSVAEAIEIFREAGGIYDP